MENQPCRCSPVLHWEKLPKDVDVHLRPNEACAIIENGSIVDVGVALG